MFSVRKKQRYIKYFLVTERTNEVNKEFIIRLLTPFFKDFNLVADAGSWNRGGAGDIMEKPPISKRLQVDGFQGKHFKN